MNGSSWESAKEEACKGLPRVSEHLNHSLKILEKVLHLDDTIIEVFQLILPCLQREITYRSEIFHWSHMEMETLCFEAVFC